MADYALDVLVASYGAAGLDRLARIQLPPVEGVRWVISCQLGSDAAVTVPDVPEGLRRRDVVVHFSHTIGLSKNRNILLDLAQAPVCLMADDDLFHTPEALRQVIDVFAMNPDISLGAFRYSVLPAGISSREELAVLEQEGPVPLCHEKSYPVRETSLTPMPKGMYLSTIELAVRLKDIRRMDIRFNENFGINQRYACGEEELFGYDVLRKGLEGRFFPIDVARHIGSTTGLRRMVDSEVLRAQGVVISRLYPYTGFLRVVLKAWRSSRAASVSFFRCLLPALKGWKEYMRDKSRLFNS